MADESSAGQGPNDVQAMTQEDLAAQAVLAHSLQSVDRSARRVKDLQLLVDCGVSFIEQGMWWRLAFVRRPGMVQWVRMMGRALGRAPPDIWQD